MAGHASRIGQVVVPADVALRTLQRDVRTGQREAGRRVIEAGIGPGRCAVAAFASLRHAGLHVVGIRGALEVLQVTRDAGGIGQVVVPVDVTLRALQGHVRTGQREACLGVIEGGIRPRCGSVAALAGLRHARLYVIRVVGSLVVLEVAGHAGGISQVVVPVDMTLRTLGSDVRSGQRKTGLGVVKRGVGPRGRIVTGSAGGRNSGLRVIGVGRALKVFHVARNAIRGSAGKLSIHVALVAADGHVRPGKGKLGEGVVIEGCGLPRRRGVATLTSLRESCLHMVRVGRLLEIGKMATHAGCGRPRKLASDVTGGAIQRNMRSGQREPGEFQMVKLCP